MSGVREQLFEALKIAEERAKAATAGPWRYNPSKQWLTHEDPGMRKLLTLMGARGEEYVAAGPLDQPVCVAGTGPADDPQAMADAAFIARWNPATVLRLVASYREMLADHVPEPLYTPGEFSCEHDGRPYPCADVERAAAFWLGTPEATDGRP